MDRKMAPPRQARVTEDETIDDQAERLLSYLLGQGIDFGLIYPYSQLERDCDLVRPRLYRVVGRVNELLAERDKPRRLKVVQKVGYKVLHARDHDREAIRHVRKGQRQIQTGVMVHHHTDVGALTAVERDRHDIRRSGLLALAAAVVYCHDKVQRVEKVQETHTETLVAHSVELAALKARVAELEATPSRSGEP